MLALTTCVWVAAAASLLYLSRRKHRRPPGPPRLPIVGNAFGVSLKRSAFNDLYKKYGALVYLEFLNQPVLLINTHEVAIDLFTRRSRLYSDRPPNYVASNLLSGGLNMLLMDYDDRLRRVRKAAYGGFRKNNLGRYHNIQRYEALRAVISMIESPSRWEKHMVTNAASVIMSCVYGLPPTDETSPVIQTVRGLIAEMAPAFEPGSYLVEFLPWLRHLPVWAAPWKRDALSCYNRATNFFEDLFHNARHGSASHSSSLAYSLHDNVDDKSIEKTEAIWLCGIIFMAGAETTSTALSWFMLAMLLHQSTQEKAQEEVDRVVGRDHPPTFDHIDKLPYIKAIVKEVLRWRPPLPLGFPHRTAVDDVYAGFDVPANTLCVPNVMDINLDTAVWGPDAAIFRPERHLTEDGRFNNFVLSGHDDAHVSFGFGQRVCVGRYFAEDTLTITCATILWACKIGPAHPENLPSADNLVDYGVTLQPAPFECKIGVRGEATSQRLKDAQAVHAM